MFAVDGFGTARLIFYVILMLAAVMSETKTKRIPNALTYFFVLLGLGLSIIEGWGAPFPWTPIGVSIGGMILCLATGIALFLQRWIGGGSVKLLIAAGTLARWPFAIYLIINFAIITQIFLWTQARSESPKNTYGSMVIMFASALAGLEMMAVDFLRK